MAPRENLPSSNDSSIETIRAIAVLLVFVHHLYSIAGILVPYLSPIGGWLGVQMFFVISGYLIIKSAVKYSALEYARHRIYRIYPAYILWFLVFSLVFKHIRPGSIDVKSLFIHLTFLQHFFPAAYLKYNALSVSWTLTVEATWYVVAFLVAKRFFKNPTAIVLWAVLVACIWTFGGNKFYPSYELLDDGQKNLFGNNNVISQLPFFFFGAWIAVKEPKLDPAGLLALIVPTIFLFPTWEGLSPHPIFITGLGVSAFFLLLKSADYKNAAPIKLISDISYSFYLVHFPIIVLVTRFTSNKYAIAAGSLLLTLLISYASYKLVEQPFIRFSKRKPAMGGKQ